MPELDRVAEGGGVRPRAASRRLPRHMAVGSRRHPIARGVAVALVFLLAFATSVVGLTVKRVQGNITTYDVDQLLEGSRPTPSGSPPPVDLNAGRALNFVVIGSDSREGANDVDGAGASGTTAGMRSDTTMLVHISADRSHVEVVSIPRDALVDIPACVRADGSQSSPQYDAMFNSAFQTGGGDGDIGAAAACTIRTVEELTGIYVDDFVVVDFAGFINVVNALGGVAMEIPEDIDDKEAGLHIQQGCRLLDGTQALGFARVRKSVGDGSDISRIGRQQDLVLAIVEEALSTNLLRNPARLYRFVDTSTQTLTTGNQVGDVGTLAGLGASLSSLRTDNVTFITMPFEWAGPRVRPTTEYAMVVWDALRADQPVDPVYSGESWAIAEALAERAAQATQPPTTEEPTTAAPPPDPGPAVTPPPEPVACTKETAS